MFVDEANHAVSKPWMICQLIYLVCIYMRRTSSNPISIQGDEHDCEHCVTLPRYAGTGGMHKGDGQHMIMLGWPHDHDVDHRIKWNAQNHEGRCPANNAGQSGCQLELLPSQIYGLTSV
jgi:hypothetical protein